jgi:HlyD family secretion protein
MRNKILIGLAVLGIILGGGSAFFLRIQPNPLPPAFKPASNPYQKGIYANGIIESSQASGENINIYPEVFRYGGPHSGQGG